MENNFARIEVWLQGMVSAALYFGAVCAVGLSLFAIESAQTGPGDADSTAGGYLCLIIAALLLGPAAWMSRRWKTARVLCAILFAAAIVVLLLLSVS